MIESNEDGDQNKVVLCDLMPIPLLDSRGEVTKKNIYIYININI
jgi:hypothetical protein